jgi:hypothetical protein
MNISTSKRMIRQHVDQWKPKTYVMFVEPLPQEVYDNASPGDTITSKGLVAQNVRNEYDIVHYNTVTFLVVKAVHELVAEDLYNFEEVPKEWQRVLVVIQLF